MNINNLTPVSFGTASIAGLYQAVGLKQAFETLETAWDGGIRYFDTAPHYGQGKAERILGDFLRDKPDDSYVISTKVGRLLSPSAQPISQLNGFVDPLPFDQRYDYSYDGIMRSVEDSYQRLGLNKIDILYVHDIGERTHKEDSDRTLNQLLEGGGRALDQLRSDGSIQAVGLGVNEVEVCEQLIGKIHLDLILLAGRYTLLDRTAELNLLPLCQQHSIKLVIGGVFNSGILATGAVEGAHWDYGSPPESVIQRVNELEQICESHGTTLANASLAFPVRHPLVVSVLLGNSGSKRLRDNLAGLKSPVTDPEFWKRIEE
ncbi:MAG: aldo/keto reductase [Cocleimonas sp.]